MDIVFSFTLDQAFFKDCYGYKTGIYEPGVFYGYIDTEISLENKPQNEISLTENDLRFRDLLNNKTIETEVQVATKGVASHLMLNSSSVMLRYCGCAYNIQIELQSFKANPVDKKHRSEYKEQGTAICKMRILDKIPEMFLSKGKLTYLPKCGAQWMDIAKYCLNHPGEYYYSDRNKFFARSPSSLDELIMIYDAERGLDKNIPSSKAILLDPLLYMEHKNPMIADFARRIISGIY